MIFIYIIVVFVVLGLIIKNYQQRNEDDSNYHKVHKKLEDDLLQANFSSDWKNKQQINAQILWLDTIKEIETNNSNKKKSELLSLTKLTLNEIKFDNEWQIDGLYHFPFASKILAGYSTFLNEENYGICFFKPDKILPYPKSIIEKSHKFMIEFLESNKHLAYAVKYNTNFEKEKLIGSLKYNLVNLFSSFIDTGNDDLPKEPFENHKVGQQYQDKINAT
jgi:hypothetical protein